MLIVMSRKCLLLLSLFAVMMMFVGSGVASHTVQAAGSQHNGEIPLYRLHNPHPDHSTYFYATNPAEVDRAHREQGFEYQGVTACIWHDAAVGRVPLLRLYNAHPAHRGYFYTINPAEAERVIYEQGYAHDGIIGYVHAHEIHGLVPLYRLFNPHFAHRGYFYTTSIAEAENAVQTRGYQHDGVAAWVLSPSDC
jgi:hypothetical protein